MARLARLTALCSIATILCLVDAPARGQSAPEAEAPAIASKLAELQTAVAELKKRDINPYLFADVAVFAKAVEWATRHNEFYTPQSGAHALAALATGLERAAQLAKGSSPWDQKSGHFIRGYISEVDGSVQPYAIIVPAEIEKEPERRWPLHVVLHGRGDKLNEQHFIHLHEGQAVDPAQTWIQLEVFGRTNNAYRWSGETDVFEALAAVKRRYRIDPRRIVLRGFSMGGAGSWHLGLHHPSLWCAVGPGAGFIDFYKYQKVTEKLPPYQDAALKIYDSVDYVLNAFDVPICTYGGELDEQLVASTSMVELAKKLEVPMRLIIGPGVGHKFHPDSFKEYMAFLNGHMEQGRKGYPGRTHIRFITHTVKYNACEWLTVEEMIDPNRAAIVEGQVDDAGLLRVKTQNVALLQIARDVADEVELDGTRLPLTFAARGLLPGVFYSRGGDEWGVLDYDTSLDMPKNLDLHKRRNLQGPIDDAFMRPFICVRGTGAPWSAAQAGWADWTLKRFVAEFDRWLRGDVTVVDDTAVTDELLLHKNLILFGDPGSNAVLKKVLKQLPIQWTEKSLTVAGREYDPATHGVALIYPNPLAPRNYIVINSGHTFHEKDFRASNAWLFPRLGDIAVQKFEKADDGGYQESTVWAGMFDSSWKLPTEPVAGAPGKKAQGACRNE